MLALCLSLMHVQVTESSINNHAKCIYSYLPKVGTGSGCASPLQALPTLGLLEGEDFDVCIMHVVPMTTALLRVEAHSACN